LISTSAVAGEFSVNPIRLELGAAARSGAIAVRNEGQQPLSFQLQAMEWTQDAKGKDQYLETRDLIFFPKILTVEPGQERVVRVGARTPVVPSEKNLPSSSKNFGQRQGPATKGTQINFLIRFGAPVFITLLKPEDGLEIEDVALAHGDLTFPQRTPATGTGNSGSSFEGCRRQRQRCMR
jgi:fimbrial chaperone protein